MILEHINITVRDLEESVAFYRTLFAAEVSWRGEALNMTRAVPAAHVRFGDSYLSLFECERRKEAKSDYAPPGLNHIGFVVDDLAIIRTRLEDLETEIRSEYVYEPGTHLYVFDPNGIELELVSYDEPRSSGN